MYNRFLLNPIPFIKRNPSGVSQQQNLSQDSDAIVQNSMPVQIFLKFPGGRIAALEFPEVTSLADVKRSLCRFGCNTSSMLQNVHFLRQGRKLDGAHPIRDGDIICIVPRLLGGVTPRGQPDRENHEPNSHLVSPNSQLFSGFAPLSFDEPFGFGSRYVFEVNLNQRVAMQLIC